MTFTCTINDKAILKFYMAHKESNIILSTSRCLKFGKKKIDHYLNKFNLIIRPFKRDDLSFLESYDEWENLCGDMSIVIPIILSDMKDVIKKDKNVDLSNFTHNNNTRLTYVLCHKLNEHIMGFVSAIINYDDDAFKHMAHPLHGVYKNFIKQDTLYVELGCSSQKYNSIVTGTNYFIRAYILLVSLENRPVNILWGQVSGSVDGDRDKLFKLHVTRGCSRYKKTDYYMCDVLTFLSEFFRRLDSNDLLKYTKRL